MLNWKVEILNLSVNNISDINVLKNVNFKFLRKLYLRSNSITNIKVFDDAKFENLELLNLFVNKDIDENLNASTIQNLKSRIKKLYILN